MDRDSPMTVSGGAGDAPDADGLGVRDVVVRYEPRSGAGSRRTRVGAEGGVRAVDGVSFTVEPGEVLALLGPSGCGKSTLLRAIAGLEPLAAGAVTWGGADLDGVPVHRRGFGLMFQDGQLFAHRDVTGNVAYGISRWPRLERAARVAELLDAVGLADYGSRQVATLSGGERQRVALARALAPRPRLLLLDEPLSALDRRLRDRLAADLREVLVRSHTTAVFVTHDHDEAFAVADRVAVMDSGHLLRAAPAAELWGAPGTRRVAEFLGYQAFVPVPSGWDLGPAGRGPAPVVAGSAAATVPVAGPVAGVSRSSVLAVGPRGFVVRPPGFAGSGGEPGWRGIVVAVALRRGVFEVTVEVELPGAAGRPAAAGAAAAMRRIAAVGGSLTVRVGDLVRVGLEPSGCAVVDDM